MAPEIILRNEEANESTDVWSLACTFCELFSEKEVWQVEDLSAMMQMFTKKETPNLERVPSYLQSELIKFFDYDVANRPGVKEILNVLESQKKQQFPVS